MLCNELSNQKCLYYCLRMDWKYSKRDEQRYVEKSSLINLFTEDKFWVELYIFPSSQCQLEYFIFNFKLRNKRIMRRIGIYFKIIRIKRVLLKVIKSIKQLSSPVSWEFHMSESNKSLWLISAQKVMTQAGQLSGAINGGRLDIQIINC